MTHTSPPSRTPSYSAYPSPFPSPSWAGIRVPLPRDPADPRNIDPPSAPRLRPIDLPPDMDSYPSTPDSTMSMLTDVHPCLRGTQYMRFDIRAPVDRIRFHTAYSLASLQNGATHSCSTSMRLVFAQCPQWSIIVTNPRSVTVYDVVNGLHQFLAQQRAAHSDWSLFPDAATGAYTRLNERAEKGFVDLGMGVGRIDLLGRNVIFGGLVPSTSEPGVYIVYLAQAE